MIIKHKYGDKIKASKITFSGRICRIVGESGEYVVNVNDIIEITDDKVVKLSKKKK